MTRYQQTVRTTDVTTGHAALEILAGPMGCRVFAIKVVSASAAVTELGVGRPAVMGDSPAAPTAFGSVDGALSSQSKLALSWGTSPTAPASFFDRVSMPAGIGFVKEFLFPQGIAIPRGQSLTLHNITGGATLDVTVDLQEQVNTAPSYKDVVLADGPVGYWRLNATGAAELDRSGNGRDATISGGVTLNRTGALFDGDPAEQFDGTNGTFVETNAVFNAIPGLGNLSVEYWFKTTDASAQVGTVDDKDAGSTNAGFNSVFLAGVPFFRIGDNVGQDGINGSGVKNDGRYHHFVGTLTRGTTDVLSIFIDGVLDVSGNCTVTGRNISQAARKLRIGAYTTGGAPNFFIGTMDEVAIYTKALTAAQVLAHFQAR